MQNIDMIVFCAEGSVILPESVHHGAAGDDDGCEDGINAVFKGGQLRTRSKIILKFIHHSTICMHVILKMSFT